VTAAARSINNACPGGARCIGSTGLCALGNDTAAVTSCISDSILASLPNNSRGVNPPVWPTIDAFNEVGTQTAAARLARTHAHRPPPRVPAAQYACPASAYLTTNCPANFRLPAVGRSPFMDWPAWFAARCTRGSYGFTYDDADNTYGCQVRTLGGTAAPPPSRIPPAQTFNRSNTYEIRFCPSGTPITPATTAAPSPAPSAMPAPSLSSAPAPAPVLSVVRIDSGSTVAVVDASGTTWQADAFFNSSERACSSRRRASRRAC
jgi:hypothetical protein